MKRALFAILLVIIPFLMKSQERFPDGTEIPEWFSNTAKVNVDELGTKYVITEYGVQKDSTLLQTEAIQKVIDLVAENGGGVVVIPKGTFLSGSLFFKEGTHLHLDECAVLKGIDEIKHYPLVRTRIEGQTRNYFAALVNADGLDGFTITGHGTINGNGLRFWEEFWIRREFNPDCTNLEALRPRLVYMSNCQNVTVQDVRLINSPFWTNHLYKCNHVRYLGCYIFAPTTGVRAPSSDALDVDFCHDILVDGCYMSVNDDAVVLKGGKGTYADKDSDNGPNYNVIVQNCTYGRVHGCLTLGSESIHDRNVILRNCKFNGVDRVLWLKMRPDTPQHYEYVRVENVGGTCDRFLVVRPWTQFYDLKEREDMPLSQCNDILFKNVEATCNNFFDVGTSDKYVLRNFTFENCRITDSRNAFDPSFISDIVVNNLIINNVPMGSDGKVAAPDYSGLTAENHPRVIYTNDDFAMLVQQVEEGPNPYLTEIHNIIIGMADSVLEKPVLERVLGAGAKRLLAVSREAEKRILSCAYAYKTTGDRKYLDRAVFDITAVCGFENWNAARHYLDAGEMSAAVGLAYDWLYDDLDDDTKVLIRKALNDFAFHPALYEYDKLSNKFYEMVSNWNSVCNGGLVCAALATYEDNPEDAQTLIDKALESNVAAMEMCYSPDGNYGEGYMYWNYGTVYEALFLTAMDTVTGSDNGLSNISGFSQTGRYMIYMEGPSGNYFNFSDSSGQRVLPCFSQWYFAWKFKDLSVLYSERNKIPALYKSASRSADSDARLMPLIAWYASKVDVTDIPAPEEHIFHGEGSTPVVLVHDTWTMDENDKFLGVKAGKANRSHAHMDAGSFVFDAEGLRWASDLGMQSYETLEPILKIWDRNDDGERWQVFRYNNFNHNTLTVNNALHKGKGVAKFLEVIDSDGRRGAVVDISKPLGDEVAEAVRTIYIEGDDLVVEDKITARGDKPADVRWTMVTPAEPVIENGSITLTQKDKTRFLHCSSSTGHEVELKTWSAQSPNSWDAPNKGFYECGYTVTVEQGETAVIEVRLTLK